jgi:hypothetical protein
VASSSPRRMASSTSYASRSDTGAVTRASARGPSSQRRAGRACSASVSSSVGFGWHRFGRCRVCCAAQSIRTRHGI